MPKKSKSKRVRRPWGSADDVAEAKEQVRVVMVNFGRLLDHVLGRKEIPEHELRNFFK